MVVLKNPIHFRPTRLQNHQNLPQRPPSTRRSQILHAETSSLTTPKTYAQEQTALLQSPTCAYEEIPCTKSPAGDVTSSTSEVPHNLYMITLKNT